MMGRCFDMRVLHINCNYIGTTLHQKMIEGLNKIGIINEVFVPTNDKTKSVINVNSNVIVSECFKKWNRFFFKNKSNKIKKRLMQLYNFDDIDIIHAYTLFTDGNVAFNLKKEKKIPYVVAVRNTDVNIFLKYMIHLRKRGLEIMKSADAVFFLSESYKEQVYNKYIPEKDKYLIEKKTYVIPNGIDEFWFENQVKKGRQLNRSNIKIIYAGRIDANKNILTTQKAIKLLNKKGINVKYTVIGKIYNKRIYNKVKKDENTIVLDSLSKENLLQLYRSNDIFVMPSFTESFGLVYAEAMSQGIPVIYTKGQGFDGQFSEGEVGYSVSARNYYDIADKIELIIKDYPEVTSRCTLLVKKFSWKKIIEAYGEIYKNVISQY